VKDALRALGSRMIEYGSLRGASRASPSDADSRARLAVMTLAVRARARAARVLWEEGALDAVARELQAAREELAAIAQAHPSVRALLEGDLRDPREPATTDTPPRELTSALVRIERTVSSLEHAARSSLGRGAVLLSRFGALATAVWLSFALAKDYRMTVHRPRYTVRTSGRWNSEYSSFFAADGDRRTNWLLPDGTFGWVELGFAPREVRTVKLYNVWQMYWYAAHAVAVEPMLSGRSLGVHELDISRTIGRGEPHVFMLPAPVRADAVRVHVRSYDGYGGGLGEVELP
jgi:hypothetical protein